MAQAAILGDAGLAPSGWPRAFVDTGVARLVELGRLSAERGAEIRRAFAETEADPHAFLATPTVVEIIATRR